jgi:lysyl endopeptidase
MPFPYLLIVLICLMTAQEAGAEWVDGSRYQPALREKSAALGLRNPFAPSTRLALPPVMEKAQGREQHKGQALHIGLRRDLSSFLKHFGEIHRWKPEATGGLISSLSIHSPEATALRVALRPQGIPEGIELRFFKPSQPEQFFGPYSSRDFVRTALFWSPVIFGDTLGVEVYAPSEELAQALSLDLVQLSHIFWAFEKDLDHIGNSGRCNIDMTCRSSEAVKDAVAKIIYTTEGRSYLCTGTLLEDTDPQSTIAYFLTANHCINSQESADTVNSFWFFEREDCDGVIPSSVTQLTQGGELIRTGTETDYSLLQLHDSLPAGVFLAGWDSTSLAQGSQVYSIHHPLGDLKKWSGGENTGFAEAGGAVNASGNYLRVVWEEGTTEGGSSGAALLDTEQRLRGKLHGGYASCSNPTAPDYYGRFDLSYPALRPWLWEGAKELELDLVYEDFVRSGDFKEYKVSTTAEYISLELFGLSADADLYVRRGDRPNLQTYDCRPLHTGNFPEICVLENSGENTYYIRIITQNETVFSLKISTPSSPPPPVPPHTFRSWLPALYLLLLRE